MSEPSGSSPDASGGAERDPIPRSLRVAAGLSWRLLLLVVVLIVVGLAIARLRLVFVPAFVAALGAAFLGPPTRRLRALGLPPGVAAAAAMLAATLLVGGVIAALAPQVASDVGGTDLSVSGVRADVESWLVDGPLGLSETRVEELFDQIEREVSENQGAIAAGAFSGALVAVEVVAGIFLAIVLLFFFLKDGERIWAFVVNL
ncbi:MAG: AI-2E family transporter, partial [Thermoleophilia bacterium]|nr:AI-2E family transporter [Thermoleophilia bacterium]